MFGDCCGRREVTAMQRLIEALCRALEAAGLTVVRSFAKGRAAELSGAVVAVSLHGAQSGARGAYDYLGMQEADGGLQALYGRSVTAAVRLTVYAPRRLGSAACMAQVDVLAGLLAQGLGGVQIAAFSVGACAYDEAADCFVCTVTAELNGYVYAIADEDEAEFTDFILKGEAT